MHPALTPYHPQAQEEDGFVDAASADGLVDVAAADGFVDAAAANCYQIAASECLSDPCEGVACKEGHICAAVACGGDVSACSAEVRLRQ
jgi:hypothetical protein